MATLSTVAILLKAFYRLVGITTSDGALIENGESADDVGYLCLTHGLWRAQSYVISEGMGYRWRARSSAITSWTGTDAADGGRHTSLPTDFLRLSGDVERSCVVQANGDPWGQLVSAEDDQTTGDGYYLKNDQLWLLRGASPPTTVYVDYHTRHTEVTSGLSTIDFPTDMRPLIVSEAADTACSDGWYPQDDDGIARIEKRVKRDRYEARKLARQSRGPRTSRVKASVGTHYIV